MQGNLCFAAVCILVTLAPSGALAGWVSGSMQHGGLRRTYRKYVPTTTAADGIAFYFHGVGGSGNDVSGPSAFNVAARAEADGFIGVVPDGSPIAGESYGYQWNIDNPNGVNEVAFVHALLARIESEHDVRIGAPRVAFGYSNGAGLAALLGCYDATRLYSVMVGVHIYADSDYPSTCSQRLPSAPTYNSVGDRDFFVTGLQPSPAQGYRNQIIAARAAFGETCPAFQSALGLTTATTTSSGPDYTCYSYPSCRNMGMACLYNNQDHIVVPSQSRDAFAYLRDNAPHRISGDRYPTFGPRSSSDSSSSSNSTGGKNGNGIASKAGQEDEVHGKSGGSSTKITNVSGKSDHDWSSTGKTSGKLSDKSDTKNDSGSKIDSTNNEGRKWSATDAKTAAKDASAKESTKNWDWNRDAKNTKGGEKSWNLGDKDVKNTKVVTKDSGKSSWESANTKSTKGGEKSWNSRGKDVKNTKDSAEKSTDNIGAKVRTTASGKNTWESAEAKAFSKTNANEDDKINNKNEGKSDGKEIMKKPTAVDTKKPAYNGKADGKETMNKPAVADTKKPAYNGLADGKETMKKPAVVNTKMKQQPTNDAKYTSVTGVDDKQVYKNDDEKSSKSSPKKMFSNNGMRTSDKISSPIISDTSKSDAVTTSSNAFSSSSSSSSNSNDPASFSSQNDGEATDAAPTTLIVATVGGGVLAVAIIALLFITHGRKRKARTVNPEPFDMENGVISVDAPTYGLPGCENIYGISNTVSHEKNGAASY